MSSRGIATTYCRPDPRHALLRPAHPLGRRCCQHSGDRRTTVGPQTAVSVRRADRPSAADRGRCLRWPAARMSTYPAAAELLPRTLILHGSNDLFCPVEWARWEQTHARSAQLVVVPGSGHGVQRDPRGGRRRRRFCWAETQLCVNTLAAQGDSMRLIDVRCCTPSRGVSGVRGVRVRARTGTGAARFHRLRRLSASGRSGPDRVDAGVPVVAEGAEGARSAPLRPGGS